jgi:hypothetical protein
LSCKKGETKVSASSLSFCSFDVRIERDQSDCCISTKNNFEAFTASEVDQIARVDGGRGVRARWSTVVEQGS